MKLIGKLLSWYCTNSMHSSAWSIAQKSHVVCSQEGGLADPRLIATVAYIMFDTRRGHTLATQYPYNGREGKSPA